MFSELGRIRALKAAQGAARRQYADRRGGLRRPGRGRRDPPPRAVRRSGVRPADLSPPARADRARTAGDGAGIIDTSFPEEPKFDHLPAGPAGVRGSSAFLTVQEGCDKFCTFCVVPYTRGAEYSRPAAQIVEEARAARRGRRARDHPARAERQRLSRRWPRRRRVGSGRPDPRARRAAGPRAHPLHDLAPARCRRRADRRPSRGAAADAVSASAGAERLGPRAGGDEPAAHRRRLSADRRAPARGAARSGAVVRSHRRLSRRERRGFPRHPRSRRARSALRRRFRSNIRRGRARPRQRRAEQVPEPVKAERLAALQALLASPAARFQRGLRRAHPAGAARKTRPARRTSSSGAAPICRAFTSPPARIASATSSRP